MHSSLDQTTSRLLLSDYSEPAELYLLRLACVARQECLPAYPALTVAFGAVMGRARNLNLSNDEMRELMSLRLEEIEASPPAQAGPLFDSVSMLGNQLGLTILQQHILAFRVIVRLHVELQNFLQSLGPLTENGLASIVAAALGRRQAEIEEALVRGGPLSDSALIYVEPSLQPFVEKFALTPGLINALVQPHRSIEDLLGFAVTRSEQPLLSVCDYPHLHEEIALLSSYLHAAVNSTRLHGVNMLLHGVPGVGKTQLVRAIARHASVTLYEVSSSNMHGKTRAPDERHANYRLSQRLLAERKNAAILFDEAEDALKTQPVFQPFQGLEKRQNKGWINQLLECNAVPTFWIANDLHYIDAAILRRFDYVLEMRPPPQVVRRKLIKEAVRELPATEEWIAEWVAEADVPPAILDRAARVLHAANINSVPTFERQFRRIVESSVAAQGRRLPARYPRTAFYSLTIVNAGADLESVVRNLAARGKGKVLLHGPPGTGKTAFVHHLAARLDRTLIVRRASDLISPFIGQTERNIARMFQDAAIEQGILFLDEADSFLQNRQLAVRSWEVTEVNELLTQMECFEGLFLCATNFLDRLDSAAMRRFGLKIRFDYLDAARSWRMFVNTCKELAPESISMDGEERLLQQLSRLTNLTPGDFAAAREHVLITGQVPTPAKLLEVLVEESRQKPGGSRAPIGFAG